MCSGLETRVKEGYIFYVTINVFFFFALKPCKLLGSVSIRSLSPRCEPSDFCTSYS